MEISKNTTVAIMVFVIIIIGGYLLWSYSTGDDRCKQKYGEDYSMQVVDRAVLCKDKEGSLRVL